MIPLPPLPQPPVDELKIFQTSVSWGITDPERFHALLDEARQLVAPGYYIGDNLFTWCRNISPLEDPTFVKSWQENAINDSDEAILWRRYILACAAAHAIHLEGDFVECGVYAGTGVKTVIDYLGGPQFPKTFWGYDTFDYNPVEGHAFPGQAPGFFHAICERFQAYPRVRLIQGLLPDSFQQGAPQRIAYLHIDLNHAEAEIAVLDALFDRVVPGGMIILDDYEWSGVYRAQKLAEDQWFQSRNYRVMPLPTGQGLVFKR
ncbi:TylF/MycF/NovP-related O-methyltransferase [Tepidimonas sp. HKU77]|uniref:TylF/MycF/NovP-related O-methyltransferase n=1 Tax=Tepidimonas sp. HKU77 TaxID=3414503 RepID=UPI003C7CE473